MSWEGVKDHFKRNKHRYGYGAAVIVVGVGTAIITALIVGDKDSGSGNVVTASGSNNVVAGERVVMENVSFISANRQGSPSWVVRCIETGEVETSQRKMARSMGIHENQLSEHLTGKTSDVDGYHFERLCLAG